MNMKVVKWMPRMKMKFKRMIVKTTMAKKVKVKKVRTAKWK